MPLISPLMPVSQAILMLTGQIIFAVSTAVLEVDECMIVMMAHSTLKHWSKCQ